MIWPILLFQDGQGSELEVLHVLRLPQGRETSGSDHALSLVRYPAFAAIALFALTIFSASVYLLVFRPLVHELTTAQLRVASEQVSARLRTLIARAEAVSHLNHDWGQNKLSTLSAGNNNQGALAQKQ